MVNCIGPTIRVTYAIIVIRMGKVRFERFLYWSISYTYLVSNNYFKISQKQMVQHVLDKDGLLPSNECKECAYRGIHHT